MAQPELTQKEWKWFKAAQSHPQQPRGGHSPAPAPNSHLPSTSPQGLPEGQPWNPQKPNPKVAARLLAPPVFGPDHSHFQTPAAPGPVAGSTCFKGQSHCRNQSSGSSHAPASLPQHVPLPRPEPTRCGGLLPHTLRPLPAGPSQCCLLHPLLPLPGLLRPPLWPVLSGFP